MNILEPEHMALLIPMAAVILTGAIIFTAFVFRHLQRKKLLTMLHEERLASLEKGIPLPPLPEGLLSLAAPVTPGRVLFKGLLWLFAGLALLTALYQENRREYLFALVPVGIGLAYLIYYFAEARKSVSSNSKPPTSTPPPVLPEPAKA